MNFKQALLKPILQAALLILFALVAFLPVYLPERGNISVGADPSGARLAKVDVILPGAEIEPPLADEDLLRAMSLTAACWGGGKGTGSTVTYNCADKAGAPIAVGKAADCAKCDPKKDTGVAGATSCEKCCETKGGIGAGVPSCKQNICGIL